jgi:hypothetical protein
MGREAQLNWASVDFTRSPLQSRQSIQIPPEFLKEPTRKADSRKQPRRHDGKEASRMERKAAGRRKGSTTDQNGDSPANPVTVKVTLHLTVGTAQRLGVESAMRRISQSAIAEEVLAAYLSRWVLPEVTDSNRLDAG